MTKPKARIHWLNSYDTFASLRIVYGIDNPEQPPTFDSLDAARLKLQEMLLARKARMLAEIASIDQNLEQFDEKYADPVPLMKALSLTKRSMADVLAELHAQPGTVQVGPLTVTNEYLSSPPSLFIFSMKEYEPVVETFSEEVLAFLLQAFADSGAEVVAHWNGVGFLGWSAQVRRVDAKAQTESELAEPG